MSIGLSTSWGPAPAGAPPPRPEPPSRRRVPRVGLVRTAWARIGEDEYLCKTRDLSEGGLALLLRGPPPPPGQGAWVDVAFDGVVRRFRGRVLYANPEPEWVRVGIGFG